MEQNDRDHEVGAPALKSSNKPSELDPMVKNLETVPSLPGGRHVNQCKENSGEDLKNKHDKGGATEHIKPACRIARNGMLRGFTEGLTNLKARIEPITDLSD